MIGRIFSMFDRYNYDWDWMKTSNRPESRKINARQQWKRRGKTKRK